MKRKNKKQEIIKTSEAIRKENENINKSSVVAAAKAYSGPLPHPDIFKQYGEVIPDAPERILKVFEEDSKHVREMQKLSLEADVRRDRRAQWMAFVVMISALVLTGISVVYGKSVAPGIITGLSTLFLTLKVLYGNNGKKDKKDSKNSSF